MSDGKDSVQYYKENIQAMNSTNMIQKISIGDYSTNEFYDF